MLQFRDQEFDRIRGPHRVQDTAQDKGLLQIDLVDQKILFPGARLENVDRREDPLVGNLAIENDLRVAGAFEFFKDHLVHPAAGVDQRGRDNGERSALFDIPRGTKEPLRPLQRVRIHTTGQNLARGRHNSVKRPTKSCDRIEKDNNISFMLDKTLGLFDHHFRHGHVARGRFVKGRADHFALHRPLHIRHLFGTFVDQQNDEIAFGMVLLDACRDILQQNRLTGSRRCHDERPLPLTDRRDQVDDPGRAVLDRRVFDFHRQPLIGIERRQVVKGDLVTRLLGIFKVDLRHGGQRKIALILFRLLDLAFDRIAGAQRILADGFRRHINIIRPREIVCLGRAQEPEPVLQHLKHAIAINDPALFGPLFQNREHHLALAHGRSVLDLELFSHRQKVFGTLRLEIGQVQTVLRHDVIRP
ncbi:hypothetical protein ISM_06745 [Roseovarius nubinhibens ISM]|uniref:Uncharacterized protein n=1 Tax=Roseovarius nubinhibens (strain ATCC BAA-591 / DSM 15170 / ISM) TaxID=89187 RepID=A3SKU1_ROSNI|nr:hypothetical protein ISM_06745 [Roseovarius nubinhibens ISM]